MRLLLTGMSATGKSSVVADLGRRGLRAVDADDGWCVPQPDGRRLWDEPRIAALLDAEPDLVLAGCEENQVVFHPRFDAIVLLSAPEPLLLQRLATRTTNPFGKDDAERDRVLADLREVEPLLRRVATHEIDTSAPLAEVVDAVERIARG